MLYLVFNGALRRAIRAHDAAEARIIAAFAFGRSMVHADIQGPFPNYAAPAQVGRAAVYDYHAHKQDGEEAPEVEQARRRVDTAEQAKLRAALDALFGKDHAS